MSKLRSKFKSKFMSKLRSKLVVVRWVLTESCYQINFIETNLVSPNLFIGVGRTYHSANNDSDGNSEDMSFDDSDSNSDSNGSDNYYPLCDEFGIENYLMNIPANELYYGNPNGIPQGAENGFDLDLYDIQVTVQSALNKYID